MAIMSLGAQRVAAAPRGSRPPPLRKRGERAWEVAPAAPLKYNDRLVIHAVDDNTNVQYERAVKEFLLDVKRGGHPFGTMAERDRTLAGYISDVCYVQQASFMMASFMPIFEDRRNLLTVAARALKSWERIGFDGEGKPNPTEAMSFISRVFFERGHTIEGAVALVQLDGWLKEQEGVQLRRNDPTIDLEERIGRGEKDKTGFDHGVELKTEGPVAVIPEHELVLP